jgi:hypothetical protein
LHEKPRNPSRLSELKLKELTDRNYDEEKQPESASVVLGHEIRNEAIRLLIASVGKDLRKERHLSLGKNNTIRNRI